MRKAMVFVVPDDKNEIPSKAYLMGVLRSGCLISESILRGMEGVKLQYSKDKLTAFCKKYPTLFCSREFKDNEAGATQILRWAVSEGHWAAIAFENVAKNTLCLISGNTDAEKAGCKRKSSMCFTKKELVELLTKTCVDYSASCRVRARER